MRLTTERTDLHGKESVVRASRSPDLFGVAPLPCHSVFSVVQRFLLIRNNATNHGRHGSTRKGINGAATGVECRNLQNDPKLEQLAGFPLLAWGLEVLAEDTCESRLDNVAGIAGKSQMGERGHQWSAVSRQLLLIALPFG